MRSKLIRRVREEVIAVVIAVGVVSILFGALYVVFDKALSRWTARDLDNRARLIWRAADSGPRAGLDRRIDFYREVEIDDPAVRLMLGRSHRLRVRVKITATSLLFENTGDSQGEATKPGGDADGLVVGDINTVVPQR